MQSPFDVGDALWARGAAWLLRDVVEHPDCVALRLTPVAGAWPPEDVVLLHPADRVSREPGGGRFVRVSRPAFWRSLARRIADLRPCDSLVTPARAAMDILPYQLEPAVAAVLRGVRRLLLADAVGLGKTIEAGVILAELLARDDGARCLVLVPPGLRDQWRGELLLRFNLTADIVDADALRAVAQDMGPAATPWAVPRVAIVSIDFAKRPEVLPALCDERWDAVVIDEAHMVSLDTSRLHAVRAVAARAARTILLTATPHSGDAARFAALSSIGASGSADPLMVFRRSRQDVGLPLDRRSTVVAVRPSRTETEALAILLAYAREAWTSAVPSAKLLATFLLKRALSSPAALALTIGRRRALLAAGPAVAEQPALPWPNPDEDDGDAEPEGLLALPALASRDRELYWLERAAAAADRAAAGSTKLRALARFVRRTRESVLVFTEYRDTLETVSRALGDGVRVATLHGGLDRTGRRAAVEAFTGGRADVLVATDAGGSGLNLHARCRVVVHLELPWNPIRLEQRVGRVDRLGQQQRVHAVHLVARGTPEERILGRLAERSRRACAALGGSTLDAAGQLRVTDEQVAEAVMGIAPPASLWSSKEPARSAASSTPPVRFATPACEVESRTQAEAQEALRRLIRGLSTPQSRVTRRRPAAPRHVRVRVAAADRRRGAAVALGLGGRFVLGVFEAVFVDRQRRLLDEHLIPVVFGLANHHPAPTPDVIHRLLSAPGVRNRVDDAVARRMEVIRRTALRRPETANTPAVREVLQPGLFDRRADRKPLTSPRREAPKPGVAAVDVLLARRPQLGWVWWPSGA